jgi:hypothetical protein
MCNGGCTCIDIMKYANSRVLEYLEHCVSFDMEKMASVVAHVSLLDPWEQSK